jgi:hypothetical protein
MGSFFSTPSLNHLPELVGIDFALPTRKELKVIMLLSGCVMTFVIEVAVGFVFSTVILYGCPKEWGQKKVSQK